jgi:hypothetical protein
MKRKTFTLAELLVVIAILDSAASLRKQVGALSHLFFYALRKSTNSGNSFVVLWADEQKMRGRTSRDRLAHFWLLRGVLWSQFPFIRQLRRCATDKTDQVRKLHPADRGNQERTRINADVSLVESDIWLAAAIGRPV